ncbi:MAG: TrkH family potassium uptake protein [Thermodesulfovibrionales bacterium]|nr:TrkH family potassium uptake protein [Thermodesulfovibrionales bacterium]
MNKRLIIHILSVATIFIGILMLVPILVSIYYGGDDTHALVLSMCITLVFGVAGFVFSRSSVKEEIKHREAFFIVTITWLTVTFFGSLPYIFSGVLHSLTDAYFESMSGFTTTGASVIKDVEKVPLGVLFWRSLTQWIGGMGIIVFALAILPMIGGGGMQLFKAEVPEISVDKLRPRIIDTAKALWLIYVGITLMATVVYYLGGMNFYDAISHAFTTLATGGFSTKNESLAHFKNPFLEYATAIFMFLASINYSLYFDLFRRQQRRLLTNNEFRFYLFITVLVTLCIATDLCLRQGMTIEESVRLSFFQVTSVMTTTGYATADFERWSSFAIVLLLVCMFFGGMIGSTAGGVKQVRILLMLKQGYRELYQLIHPHAVTSIKLDEKFLTKEVLGSIWGFVFLFLAMCVVATIGMAMCGVDLITSFSTVLSAMSNVGPALGEAGPAENYSSIPSLGKWILTFCMLIGRLEVYTVLILLVPNYWRK